MKRLLPLLPILTFAAAISAATNPVSSAPKALPTLKPASDGSRFLFVMDMSAAMKATDAANRQALFDLAFTGFDGQMRHGDTFGLWLFNDEVRVGEFPLQVWDSENPLPVASRAAQFVRAQKYSGKPRMDELLPRLQALVRGVRDVHIVLITTGEQPISGTPLDGNLREACLKMQSERKQAQKPLVIVLNARGGRIIGASVTLPGQYIELPERPAPAVVTLNTNTAPARVASTPPAPPAPRTTPQSNGPAVPPLKTWTPTASTMPATNEVVASRPKAIVAITPTNAISVPLPKPETTVVVSAAEPPSALPVIEPAAAPIPTAALLEPEPMPVIAREPAPASLAAVTPASIPPTSISPTLLMAIGATLLAACLLLLVVVLRRLGPSRPGSVITQSMERR